MWKTLPVLLIVFTLLASGCIETPSVPSIPRERTILMIVANVSLNITEVKQINFSIVEPLIEEEGYEAKNVSSQNAGYLLFYDIHTPLNTSFHPYVYKFVIQIKTWIENNTEFATYDVRYSPYSNASLLENEKQYLKDKANEVAQICNLTLNWTNVKFVVSYSD
jgi:hypothetical protein